MATVTKVTAPLRGKMKQVIRDEAKLLRLIAGTLVRPGPIEVQSDKNADVTVKVCKSPGHCAMGALMYAAGISNKKIEQFEDGNTNTLGTYESGPIARILFDTYHMDQSDASRIISGNDLIRNTSYETESEFKARMKDRMQSVLNTITNLPKRERLRPPAKFI